MRVDAPQCDIRQPVELDLDVPHLDQYFGLWAILEDPFRAAVARVSQMDLHLHVQQAQQTQAADAGQRYYPVTAGGVAILFLTGPLMKRVSSLSGGTSTVRVRRQLRLAAGDEEVRAILLAIDSPGGTVAGTWDLADDVLAAGKRKPVYAYIEDLGASAAYGIASQAKKVYANKPAMVGSIGTYAVIYDYSRQAAQLGVDVHVIRAGEFKGAGEPGTKITPEQLAEWQRIVDEHNEFFIRAYAGGRRLSIARARELADGRIHVGQAAVELGLIDGIQSFEETLNQLAQPSKRRTVSMTLDPNQSAKAAETVSSNADGTTLLVAERLQPEAATITELKAACPGASADFLMGQLEAQATRDQAMRAWIEEQNKQLAAARQEAEKAQARARRPGVDTRGTGAAGGAAAEAEGDPQERFDELVRERMGRGLSRQAAILAVARREPELHQAYLLACNPGRRAQRLIAEKFDLAAGG